jgi:hypothetical protein
MTKPQSPSLANSPLDGLVDLACRDGVDVRPTLLRVLTDLYVQKPTHSEDETIQYVELALGLIDAVDAPTRAAVATSLAAYPAAPAAVLKRLASAASAPDARQIHADVGVEDRIEAPKSDKAEATAEPDSLTDLFFAAGAEERRLILLNLDAAAERSARFAAPASADIIKRLETAALQRSAGEFARTLERALRLDQRIAERVTRDPSGEPIVVAAKALAMKAAVLQRILLFINPAVGQSVQRVYELAHLYDEMSREAAEHMLTIWRQGQTPKRPVHEPVYSEPSERGARELATPSPRRAAITPAQQPNRFKSTR